MRSSLPAELSKDLDGAFPVLVETYGSMVATMSARLTDPTTGQDIAQEVFLRAYRALARYERDQVSELDLRPWLATITRNLVRNEYRRQSRRPVVPGSLDGGPGSESIDVPANGNQGRDDHRTEDPAGRAEVHDEIARLDDLLARLTDAQREAVVLRHIVGLSVREIATALDCPQGTVKSHISRGIATLRATLGGDAAAGSGAGTAELAAPPGKEES